MSYATELAAALEPRLGETESNIHTALAPLHLGGGADVIEFRHAAAIPGVVYVSAGLGALRGQELVVATREPDASVPSMLSNLTTAALARRFDRYGSVPLAGEEGGLLFAGHPALPAIEIDDRFVSFLTCIWAPTAELSACRTHGTPRVVELHRAAGSFPYFERGRAAVAGLSELGRAPLERKGISTAGREALAAAIHAQSERVEAARGTFEASDLPVFAEVFRDLAWEQRCQLVHLTCDSLDPALDEMRWSFLREAVGRELEEGSIEHDTLANALATLERDFGKFDEYYADLDAAVAEAKRRLAAR